MPTRVVLDANVLVPGFVGKGVSARLIDIWRAGGFDLILSEHLLSEVERTYRDPYYAQRVTVEQVARILSLLQTDATVVPLSIPVTGVATQPKDDLVLSTAASGDARYLATWDRQLLKLGRFQSAQILHPVELAEILNGI